MKITASRITGRPKPNMALEVETNLEWEREPAFFLGLTAKASINGQIACDNVACQIKNWGSSSGFSTVITKRGYFQITFVIPVSAEIIQFIEERRRDQDISIQIEVVYNWQEANVTQNESPNSDAKYLPGQVYRNSTNVQNAIITRSDWLKRLAEFGWEEYEIIEVAKAPFAKDENLIIAYQRLTEARAALRNHDFSSVVAKCRLAFESAAKYESGGDTKKGFDLLLNRAFDGDEQRVKAFNNVIASLSEYAHLVRHEQYPAMHVGREEATFFFSTTAWIFSLLGSLANKNEYD